MPASKEENSPVFYFSGQIDGKDVVYYAGEAGYYMYGTFIQNPVNVYEFTSHLRRSTCPGCGNEVKITLTDRKVSGTGAQVSIDSTLSSTNTYSYLVNSTYSVQFNALFNGTALAYLWNFGDGTTSSLANPVHTYTNQGKYNVSLTVSSINSCVSVINNVQKVGPVDLARASVGIASTSMNAATFSAQVSGIPPYQYYWQFGDGGVSALAGPQHTYASSGVYPVSLRIIDAGNDTAYANYNFITPSYTLGCAANFSASAPGLLNVVNTSKVKIEWIDENGVTYTSDHPQQPPQSTFQILSAEDFEPNENGERTKRVKVKFSCRVYRGSVYKTITNAEAYLAIIYK